MSSPDHMQIDETQAQGSGNGASAAGDALTVMDSRTGRTYELPITDGTVRAMDLRQIKTGEDDFR